MMATTALNSLEWNENIAVLIDHIGDSSFPKLLADTISRITPYNSLVIHSNTGMAKPELLFHNLPNELIEATLSNYCDGAYILDPITQACQRNTPSCLTHLCELMPENFKQSDYQKRYYKQTGLRDESALIIKLKTGDYITHSIGYRTYGMETVGKRSLQRLYDAAPALISICQSHWESCLNKAADKQQIPAPQTSAPLPFQVEDISTALNSFGGNMLTSREHQVVNMMLRGHSGKVIAKELYISPETVKVHRRRINSKLGVSSHAQLFTLFLEFLSGKHIHIPENITEQAYG